MSREPSQKSIYGPFIRKVVIVLLLTGLALFLWQLRELLLLVFGAIVVAVVFHALADPIAKWTRMPEWAAVTAAIVLILAIPAAGYWLFGAELSAQVQSLVDRLPAAWQGFERRLGWLNLGGRLESWLSELSSGRVASPIDLAVALGASLVNLLLVFVGGIYLAMQPTLYRIGTVQLVPREHRALVDEALVDSGRVLKLWLKGQLLAMLLVGTLTGLGLWLLGVPSAFALGLLAGLLEFIPYVGPILSAIPGLLLALTSGVDLALWTLALYTAVQQVEGNVIQPMVQRFAVHIPPALLLFSLIGVGTLFGTIGIVLAAPLTVVAFVLVKLLYVREGLHTATDIPGERSQ